MSAHSTSESCLHASIVLACACIVGGPSCLWSIQLAVTGTPSAMQPRSTACTAVNATSSAGADTTSACVRTGGTLHLYHSTQCCGSLHKRCQAHHQAVCAFKRMLWLQGGRFYDFHRNHRSVRSTIVHFQVHPAFLTLPQKWFH